MLQCFLEPDRVTIYVSGFVCLLFANLKRHCTEMVDILLPLRIISEKMGVILELYNNTAIPLLGILLQAYNCYGKFQLLEELEDIFCYHYELILKRQEKFWKYTIVTGIPLEKIAAT